jgi:hypothetical protein
MHISGWELTMVWFDLMAQALQRLQSKPVACATMKFGQFRRVTMVDYGSARMAVV